MPKKRKVPFNCYLHVDQLDALDRVSASQGRPRAEIVREAVEQYLVARAELAPDESSSGDTAVRTEAAAVAGEPPSAPDGG